MAALVLAGALAAPGSAYAIDHVTLQVNPTSLRGKPGWQLTPGYAPGPEFFGGTEIVGVTLRRKFRNGAAEEVHGLRQSLGTRTFSFDGRRGTWRSQRLLGDVLTVNMTVTATGAERPVPGFLSCRGDFVAVPVILRGTYVLRTKTRYFGTIRRTQFRGLVTYNGGGAPDCTASPVMICTGWTQFSAQNQRGDGDAVSVFAEAATTSLTLAFREPVGRVGPVWYHWMLLTGFNPLVGELPTFEVRLPASMPITGSGTFTAGQSSESSVGPCRTTDVRGTFTGTFRTRFTGWGLRTLSVNTADARYRVAR